MQIRTQFKNLDNARVEHRPRDGASKGKIGTVVTACWKSEVRSVAFSPIDILVAWADGHLSVVGHNDLRIFPLDDTPGDEDTPPDLPRDHEVLGVPPENGNDDETEVDDGNVRDE